jgi:Ankyrin repeats (3 copies)
MLTTNSLSPTRKSILWLYMHCSSMVKRIFSDAALCFLTFLCVCRTSPRTVVDRAAEAAATASGSAENDRVTPRTRQMNKDPNCNDSGKGDGTMNTNDDNDDDDSHQRQTVRRRTLPPETMDVLSQQFALVTESLIDHCQGSLLLTYRHDGGSSIQVDETVESESGSGSKNTTTIWSSLQWACYQGDIDMVHRLIRDGDTVNIEETDQYGRTALHLCLLGDYDSLNHASGDDDDANGHCNMAHVIRYLVESCNANVDAVDGDGFTLLHRASFNNQWRLIPYLMERCQVDIDATTINDNQNTALHVASAAGHLSVIEMLLDYGASIYDENAQGQTPLDYATAMMYYQQGSTCAGTIIDPNVVALLSATTGPGVRRE